MVGCNKIKNESLRDAIFDRFLDSARNDELGRFFTSAFAEASADKSLRMTF